MSNAAIYCRVSTDDQEKEGTSLATQLEACERYCQDKGYTVTKRYGETYSGLTLSRPQLTDLRDLAAEGGVKIVVIYCLDRITRDPTHGVILTQEFDTLGVRLEAVTETVESSEVGKLINYIRGFASKLEVEKIRERTQRGKAARLKQGYLPVGTGRGPYGYRWDSVAKKRAIVDDEAEVVRRIFSMLVRGHSLNQIAQALNRDGITTKTGLVWCYTTVRRVGTNPIYCGETYYGRRKRVSATKVRRVEQDKWVSLPGVTPALVSKEIFEQAQEAMKQRPQSAASTDSSYFLTGLMRCGNCGSAVHGATLGRHRYYRCAGTKPTRKRGVICNTTYIKADEVESYVWDLFVKLASSPLTVISGATDLLYDSSLRVNAVPLVEKQIKALQKRLNTYEPGERKLYDLAAQPGVTQEYVLGAVQKLKRQEAEDREELQRLIESRDKTAARMKIECKLSEFSEMTRNALLQELTPAEKKRVLQLYGTKVTGSTGKYSFTTWPLRFTSEDWPGEQEVLSMEMVRDMEARHPDVTLGDLMDHAKLLPEDEPLLRASNKIKQGNLEAAKRYKAQRSAKPSSVTIERTSA